MVCALIADGQPHGRDFRQLIPAALTARCEPSRGRFAPVEWAETLATWSKPSSPRVRRRVACEIAPAYFRAVDPSGSLPVAATRRATFAHVAPVPPTAINVATGVN